MGRAKNPTDLPQFEFEKLPLLLNETQAATVLGVSDSYLRLSRSTGRKEGRTPAPDFIALDGSIRYHRDDLKKWADRHERRQAV